MLQVDDENITLTRGDTAVLELNVTKDDGTPYDFSQDTVVLTIKTTTNSKDILVQKTFSDGTIKIEHGDTKELKYGTYKYDVQITTGGGDVYTVITPHDFILAEEVS